MLYFSIPQKHFVMVNVFALAEFGLLCEIVSGSTWPNQIAIL
jgi:hypothetical protein